MINILEENLEWNLRLSLLKSELNRKQNRTIGLICKIKHHVPKFLLKALYYTIFHSHLIYVCPMWGQSFNTLTKVQSLQNIALRVINFKANNHDFRDLYKRDQIIKISNCIKMLNCLFLRDVLTNSTIPLF